MLRSGPFRNRRALPAASVLPYTEHSRPLARQGIAQTAVLVRNKVDAPARPGSAPPPPDALSAFAEVVGTSAVRGQGLAELEAALGRAMGAAGGDAEGELWGANERQIAALSEASGRAPICRAAVSFPCLLLLFLPANFSTH